MVGSLAHLNKLVDRSSVTAAAKKFQQADEFLRHTVEAHLTASLITFLKISDPSDQTGLDSATITNTWLQETAEKFANEVLAVPTNEEDYEADHIYNFHQSFLHMGLLYEDLREAIRYTTLENVATVLFGIKKN